MYSDHFRRVGRVYEKAQKIKKDINDKKITLNEIAKRLNLDIKGVKPFTRLLPDSSELPIPLIIMWNYQMRNKTPNCVYRTPQTQSCRISPS